MLDKTQIVVGLLIASFTGGIGFYSYVVEGRTNDKLSTFEQTLARIEKSANDQRCLNIVQRQLAAIEKRKPDIGKELAIVAFNYGCIQQFGTAVAAADTSDNQADAWSPSADATAFAAADAAMGPSTYASASAAAGAAAAAGYSTQTARPDHANFGVSENASDTSFMKTIADIDRRLAIDGPK